MLQLCNNCQWVSYLRSSGNKRNMNVSFCLVQGLIQYHQPPVQGWTKIHYKKKNKIKKHLKNMIGLQQDFLFEKKNIRPWNVPIHSPLFSGIT